MTKTVVVMGVSGSGKTTLAKSLASRLGCPFQEGDELHPPQNVAKMKAGHPLDDLDRRPWLDAIARCIGEHEAAGRDLVVTCSALKRSYREHLRAGHPSVRFLFLDVPRDALEQRLARRTGHYMPASLLASQLQTLEPLEPDEPGLTIGPEVSLEALVQRI